MRTTASLAALVTLMAVANSNAAPIGTPNGSSPRSISRARGQLRSRDVPPMPDFRDVSFAVGVPNVKCEDCREGEAKKVLVDVDGPRADVEGGLHGMKDRAFSAEVQVPGVPSGSGSVDVNANMDAGDNEGPDGRPQKQTNEPPNANDGANNGNANHDANDGGKTDGVAGPRADMEGGLTGIKDKVFSAEVQVPGVPSGSGTMDIDPDVDVGDNEGPDGRPQKQTNEPPHTDHGADNNNANHGANDGSKTDDDRTDGGRAENEAAGVRVEVKDESKTVDDKAREATTKAEGMPRQADNDAKAASSSINENVQESSGEMKNEAKQITADVPEPDVDLHAEVKPDAENHQDNAGKSFRMSKIVMAGQEPSSGNTDGKDYEDKINVEAQLGNPSVVLRR